MKRQPDDGLDAVHTRLAIAMQTPETNGPWTIDTILAECPDPECMECGRLICPHHEPLHFHHDGCPACAESSMRCPECDSANVVAGDETTMHCDSCDHIWRDFP